MATLLRKPNLGHYRQRSGESYRDMTRRWRKDMGVYTDNQNTRKWLFDRRDGKPVRSRHFAMAFTGVRPGDIVDWLASDDGLGDCGDTDGAVRG